MLAFHLPVPVLIEYASTHISIRGGVGNRKLGRLRENNLAGEDGVPAICVAV